MNAGENDAVFSCAVVQSELQELLALGHCFAGLDFDSAEIRLAEGIKIHIVLEERFDFYFGEVDRFIICFFGQSFSFLGRLLFQCRFRFHGREEEDVADRSGVGHKHEETVEADAQSACRRHAVFQSGQEIFINRMRFVVAVLSFLHLQFEPFSLVNGIV